VPVVASMLASEIMRICVLCVGLGEGSWACACACAARGRVGKVERRAGRAVAVAVQMRVGEVERGVEAGGLVYTGTGTGS
jgi:hypothetical protein